MRRRHHHRLAGSLTVVTVNELEELAVPLPTVTVTVRFMRVGSPFVAEDIARTHNWLPSVMGLGALVNV